MFNQLSRRRLMSTFAGFAAAAAINPFPKIVPALAQDSTPTADQPEAAENQVLRWLGSTTRLSVPAYDSWWYHHLQNVYMTPFVQLDSGEITPGICSDYSVSEDQLVYTLVMNADAYWSDGSKVTAHDIKASWEWLANVELSGNPYNGYQTSNVVGNAGVVSGTTTDMSGLVVLDDETLQVTLTHPYTPFIYACTDCLNSVHQKANIDSGPDWDKAPTAASGPFMVESFDINAGSLTIVPNPYWWGKKPTIERVELIPIDDAGSAQLAWNNDDCEIWGGATSEFYRQFGNDEIIESSGLGNAYLLFNTAQAPFDDVHFRRAVQRAIDLETAINVVFGDFTVPATGLASPADPSFGRRPFLFNVEEAKAELALSAYANGDIPQLLSIFHGADNIALGTIFQQMLNDHLGIQMEVVGADLASSAQQDSSHLRSGSNSVLYIGPGGLITWSWHAEGGLFDTHIHTRDEDVEQFLVQGDSLPEADIDGRIAAYQQAEDLIIDSGYTLPLHWRAFSICAKERVVNAALNASLTFDLTNSYIAKKS